MLRKIFFVLFIALFISPISIFSQSGSTTTAPQMPQMPQVPAVPQVPSVPSVPTIPAIPSVSPTGPGNTSATGSPPKPAETGKSGSSASNPAGSTGLSSMSLLQALTGSLFGGEGDSGDPLSALLGGGSSSDSASLKRIQELLEKAEARSATLDSTRPIPAAPANTQPLSPTAPHLERLVINGVNILSTISVIIPSAITSDGTFLLTGERTISASEGLSEIFYFMCRSLDGQKYMLHVDLSQSKENPHSFLYQLVRKTPLEGTKTGDLLVFRFSEANWQSDIVIRLPSALVR